MSLRALWLLLVVGVLCVSGGCGPPASKTPTDRAAAGCADGEANACELALLGADDKTLVDMLDRYAKGHGGGDYQQLFTALREAPKGPLWISANGKAPTGMHALTLPKPPRHVSRNQLIARLARASGHNVVVVATKDGMQLVFPRDVLAPFMLGLPAEVGTDSEHLAADVAFVEPLRAAFAAASRYDYVSAARHADKLRGLVYQGGVAHPSREAQLRARVGMARLVGAGIMLQPLGEDTAKDTPPPKWGAMTTPYTDLLVVMLAEDASEQWRTRRDAIVAHLDNTRRAQLDARHSDSQCATSQLPPMNAVRDMSFAYQLSVALDPQAAPGEKAAAGKLALRPWLERYDTFVKLVNEQKLGWYYISILLSQRGEAHGLSARGTNSYSRVSEMAMTHISALEKLSSSYPDRFQTLGVVGLVFRPGVWTDQRVGTAVAKLIQNTVRRKLVAAKTGPEAWEGTFSAFAAGMSYPPQMQALQLDALRRALKAKLATPFGKRGGWSVAGLQGVQLLLEAMLGGEANFAAYGPLIFDALKQAEHLPQPELARLGAAAARYITLAGKDQLAVGVTNPRSLSPARLEARETLSAAIGQLAKGGPETAGQRKLRDQLASFGDALIAGATAQTSAEPTKSQCAGQSAIGAQAALRPAFDQLRKKRTQLLALPEMKRGSTLWLKRTRGLALLLSDILDVLDQPNGTLTFTIVDRDAQRFVDDALGTFGTPDIGSMAGSLLLIGRNIISEQRSGSRALIRNVVSGLSAASRVFGEDAARGGIFKAMAAVGKDQRLFDEKHPVSVVLLEHAKGSYNRKKDELGDILMMLALGSTLASDEPAPPGAIELARKHERPIELALLLYSEKRAPLKQLDGLKEAMRKAVQTACQPPSPAGVLKVRRATQLFRKGQRKEAVQLLDQLLADSARDGLIVPRQIYTYKQVAGDRAVRIEQSLSFAGPMLRGSGSLQFNLSYQSNKQNNAQLQTRMAPSRGGTAEEEAARLYAYSAIVASVYHRLLGNHKSANATARRAVEVWAKGVRLGDIRTQVGQESARWAGDALGVLAIAAQQAVDHKSPFLAGDLYTLMVAALGTNADDTAVKGLLEKLPHPLIGTTELAPVVKRIKAILPTLTGHLACTNDDGKPGSFTRVSCDDYPQALSMRIAGGLKELPRLRNASSCDSWHKLDSFLGAADQQRYDPQQMMDAVTQLLKDRRDGAAAILLTRHRPSNHCSPQIVKTVRSLAKKKELGIHERTGLLSVATNCDPSGGSPDSANVADIAELDELTQQHASPVRNFELLVYTARLALQRDNYASLAGITNKPGFIRRWHKLGPQMGTAALLLQHAAAIGTGKPIDKAATLPYYRLLCTTFPGKERGPMCNNISLMRNPEMNKKPTAKQALAGFIEQAVVKR